MYMTKKTDGCKNNPENLSTTKVGEHIPSGFANSAIASFRSIKNKHDAYRGKYLTKFCEFLRQHSMKNIVKLEIIVILLGNIEMLHLAYVI